MAKAITNQRTPEEIKEIVEETDKELPEHIEEDMEEDGKMDMEDESNKEPENDPYKEETPEDTPEEKPVQKEVKKEVPAIEDRYRESSAEATVLFSKNKNILETIEKRDAIPEPTEAELQAYAKTMGAEFEDLDAFAQNMLKKQWVSEKKEDVLKELMRNEREVDAWLTKVDTFLDSEEVSTTDEYKLLLERKEEFKRYCAKKTHINADFELLVAGFMMKQPKEETPASSVLLNRGGGSRTAPTPPTELTQDDAPVIRAKSMRDYMESAKKGKIKISV